MKQKTKFKKTEIGMIPEDWTLTHIEDIKANKKAAISMGPFGSNITKDNFVAEGVPVIRGNNLTNYRFKDEDFVFLSEEKADELSSSNCFTEDIVITHRGTLGQVGIIPKHARYKRYVISQSGMKLTCDKNKAAPDYIFYFLKSPKGQYLLLRNSSQTGVPAIAQPLSSLRKIIIPLPDILEQSAIEKILSDLDAKIEISQQMNKTLEEIGQALFKHWFVDFEFPNEKRKPYKSSDGEMVYNEELRKEIPKGWEVGYLGDIIENIKKSLKAGDEIKDRKYVPIDLLSMKTLSIISYLPYHEARSSLIGFEKDDILVGAMRVYFHRVNLAPFSGVTRSTTFVLRPIRKGLLSYSLLLMNQDETINYANAHSKGSTMPYAVWNNSLEKMACLIPQNEIIENFHKLIYPMLSKIRGSLFEIYALSQIRDSLLPKLMSGKIRVLVEAA